MKLFRSFEEASGIRNPVVTTGSFDGVHIGHKAILKRLKQLAKEYNGESVLITFEPHPRKVLYPETIGKNLKLINSPGEKLALLSEAGLDNLLIINFTPDFSKITSEEFVRDFLHGILKARVIVAGFNHHFGFNKQGDYRQLWDIHEKYGFEAVEIPEQDVQNETVSSTKIRQALKEGFIQKANAYLDHYYIVMGMPERYNHLNHNIPLSLMKIPVDCSSKLLPSEGIYAVTFNSGIFHGKGMAIINKIRDDEQELLLHLLNVESYPFGTDSTISFHKKVHGAIDISDQRTTASKLKSAADEISELIY